MRLRFANAVGLRLPNACAVCHCGVLWQFAIAVCHCGLPLRFAVAVCRCGLPLQFANAACHRGLPLRFAMAICHCGLSLRLRFANYAVSVCKFDLGGFGSQLVRLKFANYANEGAIMWLCFANCLVAVRKLRGLDLPLTRLRFLI